MRKYILFTLLILQSLIFVQCNRPPLVEVDRKVITGTDVFNVEHRGIEGAVKRKYWTASSQNKIDSVRIISKEPVGATSNWFSGNALYYEIEYEVVIVYYARQDK